MKIPQLMGQLLASDAHATSGAKGGRGPRIDQAHEHAARQQHSKGKGARFSDHLRDASAEGKGRVAGEAQLHAGASHKAGKGRARVGATEDDEATALHAAVAQQPAQLERLLQRPDSKGDAKHGRNKDDKAPRVDATAAKERTQTASDEVQQARPAANAVDTTPKTPEPTGLFEVHAPKLPTEPVQMLAPDTARLVIDLGGDALTLLVRARDQNADVRVMGTAPVAAAIGDGVRAALSADGFSSLHSDGRERAPQEQERPDLSDLPQRRPAAPAAALGGAGARATGRGGVVA